MTEKNKISPAAYAIELSKAWGDNFPISAEKIAYEISQNQPDPITKVASADLSQFGIEGFLNPKNHKWAIGYHSGIREAGKINFVVAHELGHYLCHRKDDQAIRCKDSDFLRFAAEGAQTRDIEEEANNFASFLLMPIGDFRKQIVSQEISINLIDGCACRYDTSLTATTLKLLSFTDKSLVLIISKNGKVLWSRSSDSAYKNGLFFKKGTDLPSESDTYKTFLRQQKLSLQSHLPASLVYDPIWEQEGWVKEMIVPQPYYDSIFTLLEFENNATKIRTDSEDETYFSKN